METNERVRRHRISVREFASDYFRLDPQPASWGRSELEQILSAPSPLDALSSVEKRVGLSPESDRPRLRRLFLEALDGAFGSDRPFTSNWLAALVEVSPKYIEFKDDRSHDFFFVDNLSRLNRVLWKALEPSNSYERFGLLAKVAEGAKDLVLLSDFFRMRVGDVNPDGAKRERDEAYFGTRTSSITGHIG